MDTGLNISWNDILTTHIGGMALDCKTGEWTIIGASDTMNREFRERMEKNTITFGSKAELDEYLKDMVRLEVESTPITSENYWDFRKPTQPMPKHCYGTDYGHQQHNKIKEKLEDHYLNRAGSREELKNYFKDCCKDMRVTLAQDRKTTGMDAEHNRQIILDTYEIFRQVNSVMANLGCNREGKKLAQENGWQEGKNEDWVYYNADYYYEWEALMDVFREAAGEMAEEWKCGEINTSERDIDHHLSYSSSFNQVWKNGSENGARICSMIDISEKPPEGFYLFFRDCDKDNAHVGLLEAGIGETPKIREEIIFDVYGIYDQHPQFHHLSEFLKKTNHADSAFQRYLSNFDVYTRYYGTVQMRQ